MLGDHSLQIADRCLQSPHFRRINFSKLREIIAEVVAPQRSDQVAGLPQDIPLLSPASGLNSGPTTGLNALNALLNN